MSYNLENTRVIQFLILETGAYGTQYRRPYETNLGGHTMMALTERLGGAQSFSPSLVAGVANQFIQPQAQPERPLVIPNGWSERRLRFQLKLEHKFRTGNTITEIVLGYTDNPGITIQGSIDPNMEFYINSTIHLRTIIERTPFGNQTHVNVSDSSHILANNEWQGMFGAGPKDQRMRPEDVYATMTSNFLKGNTDADIFDGRVVGTSSAAKSRRSNAMATDYMSNVLENYRQASYASEYGQGPTEVYSSARGKAAEHNMTDDPFIMAITRMRGAQFPTNTFNFKDLVALDPNTPLVTEGRILDQTTRATTNYAQNTEDWGASDRATQVATILSQSVPGLMMELALTGIIFQATNMLIGGQTDVTINNYESFSNKEVTPQYLELFMIRLKTEILRDLSFNDQISYAIEMYADLMGDTRVILSLDGYNYGEFVTPSFCDALMVPVVTADMNRSNTLSSDFDDLFNHIAPNVGPTSTAAFGNF